MPRLAKYVLAVLFVAALLPLALVARSRSIRSPKPRLHVVYDMDQQPKYKPQAASPLFPDGRAMRPPVQGTIARGELALDAHYFAGKIGGEWADTLPIKLTAALMRRGQQRYNIFCSPCHGMAGYGDGMVAKRADEIEAGKWVPPASLHSDVVRGRPVGHLFNTITNGIRNMPAYGAQIPVPDRWAIVAYIRALQRSQHARIEDVPQPETGRIKEQ